MTIMRFLRKKKSTGNKLTLLFGLRYDIFQERIQPTEGLDVLQEDQEFGHTSWRTGGHLQVS